jgi:hypothetical protein
MTVLPFYRGGADFGVPLQRETGMIEQSILFVGIIIAGDSPGKIEGKPSLNGYR